MLNFANIVRSFANLFFLRTKELFLKKLRKNEEILQKFVFFENTTGSRPGIRLNEYPISIDLAWNFISIKKTLSEEIIKVLQSFKAFKSKFEIIKNVWKLITYQNLLVSLIIPENRTTPFHVSIISVCQFTSPTHDAAMQINRFTNKSIKKNQETLNITPNLPIDFHSPAKDEIKDNVNDDDDNGNDNIETIITNLVQVVSRLFDAIQFKLNGMHFLRECND